jgi:hypothetical protein
VGRDGRVIDLRVPTGREGGRRPSCPLRVCGKRYRHNVLSQPGPEHGRVGVHPRAHVARGHDPDGAKRNVPHGDDHRGADGDGARVTELARVCEMV